LSARQQCARRKRFCAPPPSAFPVHAGVGRSRLLLRGGYGGDGRSLPPRLRQFRTRIAAFDLVVKFERLNPQQVQIFRCKLLQAAVPSVSNSIRAGGK
jgi:hypothetical protein